MTTEYTFVRRSSDSPRAPLASLTSLSNYAEQLGLILT